MIAAVTTTETSLIYVLVSLIGGGTLVVSLFLFIDFEKMKGRAERLGTYCAQNPNMSLMTAAENIMGK